ncbi:MAG: molecular chaperone TorD family protein [Verrucomicrobia bacterium]|nr:molecular chaperone TorD family protein [Verrucomicrobiota bacterium]
MNLPRVEKREDFVSCAPGREVGYQFLSGAFAAPPSAAQLAELGSPEFVDKATGLFGEASIKPLLQFAETVGSPDEVARQARQEFMNLFQVPGAQYVAPYESVFRDERELEGRKVSGLLLGPSALAVQQWYRLAALDISPECRELPDHIAVELSYLAQLCAKEQEFAGASDDTRLARCWEMERDFLAAHVVRWVEPLCRRIREKTQHPYFAAVAELLVTFTRRDLATLEDLLGPSDGSPVPVYADRNAQAAN